MNEKIQQNEFPNLPARLTGLGELAENLWWSWNPAARMIFKSLNRQAWKESGYNPDKMLKELPVEVLEQAAEIYLILEKEIIPLYYNVSEEGVPFGWVKVMKESIKSNPAKFSARGMVKEYVGKFYQEALKSMQN